MVPTSLSHGIKLVNPMFRGYAQQVGRPSCPGNTQGCNVPGLALKPRPLWKSAAAALLCQAALLDQTCCLSPSPVWGRRGLPATWCSPHSTDGETEAQRPSPHPLTTYQLHSWYRAEGEVDLRQPYLQVCAPQHSLKSAHGFLFPKSQAEFHFY